MKKKWFGMDPFNVILGVVTVLWLVFLIGLAVDDDRTCPGRPGCNPTSVVH
ncbi:hypothetical protein OG689_12275 [Kitasatospora sp. NBC_00240]|uniref:hypothetical protein n=1 Tax=Kitasatospora sp. NBC_00240 TaxID=2903567 RepID=UPI002257C045|nr:hypothetical protein [Kitasatospora sp. NBC_00240]MCX5210060.1 hypothetical protein [Kitasatospora sp. NBC_00240]